VQHRCKIRLQSKNNDKFKKNITHYKEHLSFINLLFDASKTHTIITLMFENLFETKEGSFCKATYNFPSLSAPTYLTEPAFELVLFTNPLYSFICAKAHFTFSAASKQTSFNLSTSSLFFKRVTFNSPLRSCRSFCS
jgi:hypothetical protein